MRIFSHILNVLRCVAFGQDLRRAMRRNDEAARRLDAAVKEVLGK